MADRFKEFFDDGDPDKIFILEEEIASGSFGSVYKGRHYQTGVHYAVKIITPEEDEVLDDFMVEISILKKCKNPNIVGFFGAWLKGEELFIAMELCEGGAITDIFSVCQESLEEDQIALITRETLKALSYLHSQGIIHRDVKGANILLTNDGDIKLVDFGVSAELKHPGDRRNTLIGTPYWMSPEVIANKTGNVPYDTKADMWSLGITLLELADMNPPLHEIHPMKALMMIPMRDPPTFQNPEKWSKEFRDFVSICLRKAPEKRQSSDEMLKHSFVSNCKDKSILTELISKRKRLEALEDNQSQESDDESNSSSESSDEREVSPAPVKQSQPKSSPAPGGSVIKGINNGELGSSSSPKADPIKNTKPNAEKSDTKKKPESSNNGSSQPAPSGRGGATPAPNNNNNKANRPTYRTNKKMTSRQIKEHEQNLLNKKMVQKRMQEIRAKNKEHESQQKKLQQKQQRDQAILRESLESKLRDLKRQQQSDLKKMLDNQKAEKETLDKDSVSNTRKLEKEQKAVAEKASKKLNEESKNATKEFKKELKQEAKEEEEKFKKEKAPKQEREQKARQTKLIAEWKEKLFVDKQNRDKFEKDYDQKHRDMEAHFRHTHLLLERNHAKLWRHLLEIQALELEQLQASHQIEIDRLKQIQPQEMNHLLERLDLDRKQLQEQQKMELEQQQKILLHEQKQQKSSHKKAQNKRKEELNNEIKNLSKTDKKSKGDELRAKLKAELDAEDIQFAEKQRKQREEEEAMIKRHHQSKEVEFEEQRKEAITKLENEHEEQRKKLKEEHEQQEKEMLKKHIQSQKDLQAQFQEEMRSHLTEYHKTLNDALKEYIQNQRKLYEDQHKEQLALKQKQKAEEADIQQLLKEHEEDLQLLSQKQQKEVEIQEHNNQSEKNELEEMLAKQRKQLEDEHNSDVKTSLTSLKADTVPSTPEGLKKKKAKGSSPGGSVRGSKERSKDSIREESTN